MQSQYAQNSHKAFIGQVNQTDLQAQVFVRNMNQKSRDMKHRELGPMSQDAAQAQSSGHTYSQSGVGLPPYPNLVALRMIKDNKKNEWQL